MERGSDIVRLQDLNIFAGIPSTPVAFLEPDFEMKDCIFSLVIGLKSKGMGAGMLEVMGRYVTGGVVSTYMFGKIYIEIIENV